MLALVAFGYGGLTSFSSLFADALHVAPRSLFLTAMAAAILLGRVTLGRMLDQIGHRRVFLTVLGGLAYMHPGMFGAEAQSALERAGPALLLVGLVPFAVALLFWFRSDMRFDAAYPDFAAGKVPEQRTAMILFLVSEAFFFFGFFWAFIRFGVNPEFAGASTWPPPAGLGSATHRTPANAPGGKEVTSWSTGTPKAATPTSTPSATRSFR